MKLALTVSATTTWSAIELAGSTMVVENIKVKIGVIPSSVS